MQVTFDANKLAAYAAAHPGKNVLITKDSEGIRATIVDKPVAAARAMSDDDGGGDDIPPPPLDGCPYPPGCTE